MNPQYRRASIRTVSHFVTDIDFSGKSGDSKERKDLDTFLRHQIDIFGMMLEMGEEWACFQGDTIVPTRNGVFKIKELAGKKVDVLSEGGVYRPAVFNSYGVQNLWEVELSDGTIIKATPNHQWIVRNGSGKKTRLRTDQLTKSHSIERTVAPRPDKNEDYYEGIRHGFIFGDGSMSSKGKRTTALFMGEKDKAMLTYFEGYGNLPRVRRDRPDAIRQSGFSPDFKSLPDNEATDSYWYGFVSGFLAADGTTDAHGCVALTQKSKEVLETIVAQLPRIGMVAGPIRSQTREVDLTQHSGPDAVYTSTMHFVTLLKRFMTDADLLIPAHKDKFKNKLNSKSKYGRYIRIKQVHPGNRREEVFCCVEPKTNSFVVGNGILTSNCYGNAFSRIHFPTDRWLVDTRGNYVEYSFDMFDPVDIKYLWREVQYEVPDPKTMHLEAKKRKTIKLPFFDRPSKDLSRIKLRKLDPRMVNLQHSFISGRTQVIYSFDPEFVSQIKKGLWWQANETPIPMLKAISKDEDFCFHEGHVFHFKAPTISGISNHGWGIPEVLANYRSLHQLQVYRKIDEAVGLDYMLPFRLFSPNTGPQVTDATVHMLMSRWGKEIGSIIKKRREDPFAMHALPFPVTYQEFGAEGKNLAPKDLIEFQTNDMLDSMGYPAELHRGTLAVQQIPTTLRLFQNSFHFIHRGFDNYLKWAVKRILDYLGRAQMSVELQLPSMADDLEARNIYMQLAAGAEIPRDIAYKPLGIDDPVGAIKRRMEEDIDIQRTQAKLQKDFEREQTLGSMDDVLNQQAQAQAEQEGGGGSGGGSASQSEEDGATPMDRENEAKEKAQMLVEEQDQGVVKKELANMKASNPQMHAMVKEFMEQIRSEAESQGRASLKQPQQ